MVDAIRWSLAAVCGFVVAYCFARLLIGAYFAEKLRYHKRILGEIN
jgi:hypothetical protein